MHKIDLMPTDASKPNSIHETFICQEHGKLFYVYFDYESKQFYLNVYNEKKEFTESIKIKDEDLCFL